VDAQPSLLYSHPSTTMESSDDEPLVAAKNKKIKTKTKVKPEPVASSASAKKRKREPDAVASSSASSSKAAKKGEKGLKKRDRAERLQHAMQSFLWWNAKEPPPGWQWSTMQHAGVSFPEAYIPHKVKMLYDGKPVDLNLNQEEA
jgi:DNA topoisomerase-1